MAEMAMFNIQRAITPKVGKPGLRFMCSECRLLVLYINLFVFVLVGLYVAFSTIFQSYRDGVWMWQGAQCSLLECCLTEILCPRHLT